MKTKLILVLALLFVLDGIVLAGAAGSNSSPAFKADGVAQTQRRRKKRRAQRVRKARSYAIKAAPEPTPPPPAAQTAVEPEPEPEAMPKGGVSTTNTEFPNVASPPPPAADPQDAPGRGREPAPSKKAGPRIKPPTVQIKPPTR